MHFTCAVYKHASTFIKSIIHVYVLISTPELKLAQKTLEDTKHEVSEVSGRRRKEEKKISNLTEELNRLQDHLSQLTVPKEQYDAVNSELKESYYENQKMARDISDSRVSDLVQYM